ncbi:MAG TPA: aldehyde dehydrogenase family protein, partial [Candidatus Poseidoniales archaeon]
MGPGHRSLALRRGGMTMPEPIHVLNAIGGTWAESHSGLRMDDVGPKDGTVVATLPRSNAEDVDAAVEAAEAAQPAWGARSIADRADMLDRIADVMEANADALAELEALDTGKPWEVARHVD